MFKLGSTTIEKVVDMDLNGMTLQKLLPALDVKVLDRHPEWLPEGTVDADGHALLSIHSWLVRHQGLTILIDAGAGNDKPRPQQPELDHLSNPFLERLAAAGAWPEEVDVVLHTHIHSDHVGWDTKLEDGRWVPTFPNAEVICSDLEWRYGAALAEGDEKGIAAARREAGLGEPIRIPVGGTFEDSVRPLENKVRVRRVRLDGAEVLPGIRFIPTPGHSIDHASIEIVSDGQVGLFSGDVFHHPVEIYAPELVSSFCEFPDAARRSRQDFMSHAIEREATVFTAHFPLSSSGRFRRNGDGYEWRFG